jgi:exocyst complex protein 7
MAEVESIQNLVAARQLLECSLEKSRAYASELDEMGLRLEMISQRLPSLEAAPRSISVQKSACRDHIDLALAPAAAVLKVFDTALELEKSLLSHKCSDDLFNYLSLMKRLEQVLRFLADNCGLAIKWLEGIIEDMEDNASTNVKKCLGILQELQAKEECSGVLSAAFEKLEIEFKRLVTENSVPLALATSNPNIASSCSGLPAPTIQKKLQAIVETLNSHNQLGMCISVYVDVRSSNAKQSLQALGLDYLEMSKFDDHIEQWSKHLVLAVKHLFELEYRLCREVFKNIGGGPDVGMRCFAKIAAQSGILAFLQFGKHVTQSNKDPIMLLKLLDMFASLDNLRIDFNRLFGGEDCTEIQKLTRDLVKRIVDGACQIFWQLPLQVGLQGRSSPPSDGSLPWLVSSVTSYCNQLLGDEYRPLLAQVLVIHHSWKQESYEEGLISYQVCKIMKEIGLNLDRWSKDYEDISLSYLFMMNNHCHFWNLKGTKLGEVMGDSWLTAHGQYTDYYAALYLRESWGNVVTLVVTQKGAGQDLVKKRLKAFNEAFDERYKKQSKWIIPNENLRKKVCQHLQQAILPVYGSYMQNYRLLVEQDDATPCPSKYVKYSVQNLEKLLSCMFQPTLSNGDLVEYTASARSFGKILSSLFPLKLIRKYGSTKHAQWMNRITLTAI